MVGDRLWKLYYSVSRVLCSDKIVSSSLLTSLCFSSIKWDDRLGHHLGHSSRILNVTDFQYIVLNGGQCKNHCVWLIWCLYYSSLQVCVIVVGQSSSYCHGSLVYYTREACFQVSPASAAAAWCDERPPPCPPASLINSPFFLAAQGWWSPK